ncbi:MAG: 3-oxoacyl-(acyl-carrier-protein) synthase 3 [candidate division WS2 bacterium]|uniref:Beta-ketoacyl-[acyl-carrier-protein] synthase III n=1 Tax=Psychracetigena formicireducens TaxID=2986056 RepID=A0A9E2BGE6_PSYF1|nr:3-oxoacyl-(acyl-carrier-protein) synthase 3 [Candidatus Psychracetigena formicireducens]MBT9145113.1 3-oxoacyl-(acyl-carrier-protein) synthase 3 [Candidatus Psychracetigena formicireducens]
MTIQANNNLGVKIAGCGFFVPERKLNNLDLEKMVDTSDEWILQRTGIKERYLAAEGVGSSDLAVHSSLQAIKSAGIRNEDVDLIIVATVTPDYPVPSCANLLQDKIGATRAGAFDLNAGCSGFAYGLMTGSQFIINGSYKNVLVVGVDLLSRITDFTDRNTCVLLGDGAGSVILQRDEGESGPLAFTLGSDGGKYDNIIVPAGGSLHPASITSLENKSHYVRMDGRAVFEFAVNKTAKVIQEVLQQAAIDIEHIDYFLLHQANLRILEGVSRKLKIPWSKILVNIDRYGNTSAASLPILLTEAVNEGKIKKGQLLLFAGFGAGLSWGVTIWRW